MENNRPFMPPPPPKMPPQPPKENPDVPPVSTPDVPSVSMPETAPVQQNVNDNAMNAAAETILAEENTQNTEQVAKEKKSVTKEQKKSKLLTALYWGGFVLCLAGIALCIYFIVK